MNYQAQFESLLGIRLKPNYKGEVTLKCPFHDDHTPSFSINVEKGVCHCFGCGWSGSIYQLAEALGKSVNHNKGDAKMENQNIISEDDMSVRSNLIENGQEIKREQILEDTIEFYVNNLLNAQPGNLAEEYFVKKNIDKEIITKFRIGLAVEEGLRDCLSAKGHNTEDCVECGVLRFFKKGVEDSFVNSIIFPVIIKGKVRYIVARQLGENVSPKYLNLKGSIEFMFNEDVLEDANQVIIAEGIPDCLTLIQQGFQSVAILGAGLFKSEFVEKFERVEKVYSGLDNDLAGFKGLEVLHRELGDKVHVIDLPNDTNDMNDYFLKHSSKDFKKLMKSAKCFEDYCISRLNAKDIHILDIEYAENWQMKSLTEFKVVGVGANYIIPHWFKVDYIEEGSKSVKTRDFIVPSNNHLLIKMCKESLERQMKDLIGYARYCFQNAVKIIDVKIKNRISITELIVLPKIKELKIGASGSIITEQGKEYRQKVVYLEGVKDTSSNTYKATGFVLADPRTSEVRFLVNDFEVVKEDFDKFKLSQDIIKQFDIFKRKPTEDINDFLNELAESAAYHFIKIYGEARGDAIIADLLCFHSPLYYYFEDEVMNGWLQIAFVGDTTTGKSQIGNRTRGYLDIGVYATGETCSRTGFLYAIDTKTLSACILRWGLLPQQDRSILMIDGANYISQDDWGTAREARRSGKLTVERVIKGEHPCRTRLMLFANPPKSLSEYIYPIECIKDLFQEPDIARLDLVVCFSQYDVPKSEINIPQEDRSISEKVCDQKTLKDSVFWAWSRKPEDIIINSETVRVVYEVSERLTDKFGCADIPLISNDVKYKVVKVSTALACLIHSADAKHEKVIVTPEIVLATEKFIDKIYTANNSKLDLYAKDNKAKTELTSKDFEVINDALIEYQTKDRSNIIPDMMDIIKSNNSIRLSDLAAQLDKSESTIKEKIKFFKKHGLVRTGRTGYVKTGKFVQFYNKLHEKHSETALPAQTPLQEMTPARIDRIKKVLRESNV